MAGREDTAMAHRGFWVWDGTEGVMTGTQTQVQALVLLLQLVTSNTETRELREAQNGAQRWNVTSNDPMLIG